jgi:hypothetical protein
VTAAMSSLAGEDGMSGSDAGLRREARNIVDESLKLLARDIRRFRGRAAVILDGFGMVPTIPDGSYLVTDETKHIDYTTGGVLTVDPLTPGYRWQFDVYNVLQLRYGEITLTVNANGEAQLCWGKQTANASGQTRFQWNSRTYPGDPVGWRQMMTDMWSAWGKNYR